MAARIIPFLRPVPKEAPVGIRPPIVTRFREDYVVAGFLGTKEQLIAWDVAEERLFPVPPKRVAYNGSEPKVSAVKGGLFEVTWCGRQDKPDMANRLKRVALRVIAASAPPVQLTTAMLRTIAAWRLEMLRTPGYAAGLLEPLDRAISAFEHAACAMAMEPEKSTVVPLPSPPDEREPEHAQ